MDGEKNNDGWRNERRQLTQQAVRGSHRTQPVALATLYIIIAPHTPPHPTPNPCPHLPIPVLFITPCFHRAHIDIHMLQYGFPAMQNSGKFQAAWCQCQRFLRWPFRASCHFTLYNSSIYPLYNLVSFPPFLPYAAVRRRNVDCLLLSVIDCLPQVALFCIRAERLVVLFQ